MLFTFFLELKDLLPIHIITRVSASTREVHFLNTFNIPSINTIIRAYTVKRSGYQDSFRAPDQGGFLLLQRRWIANR